MWSDKYHDAHFVTDFSKKFTWRYKARRLFLFVNLQNLCLDSGCGRHYKLQECVIDGHINDVVDGQKTDDCWSKKWVLWLLHSLVSCSSFLVTRKTVFWRIKSRIYYVLRTVHVFGYAVYWHPEVVIVIQGKLFDISKYCKNRRLQKRPKSSKIQNILSENKRNPGAILHMVLKMSGNR